MITFRCTQKVRKLLALKDSDLWEGEGRAVDDWFADTATFEDVLARCQRRVTRWPPFWLADSVPQAAPISLPPE
jgi:hypothetical protein